MELPTKAGYNAWWHHMQRNTTIESTHMNAENVTALQTVGVEVDFILAGCTPILHVMDKGLHKPFKQYLKEQSAAWMVVRGEGEKPTCLDIPNLIQVAWDQVSVSTILNTWQSIGIQPFHV
jgi:hypothetical protein